jgi:hypothetical protein
MPDTTLDTMLNTRRTHEPALRHEAIRQVRNEATRQMRNEATRWEGHEARHG